MDRRLRTNLLLAVAVAVIGAVIWLVPKPQPEVQTFALFETHEPITRIDVRENGQLHFTLRSNDGRWNVTAPFRLPGDEFQVNALLDALHQRTARRYAIEDASLAELGLDRPRWSVHVNGVEMLIGNRTALGNDRYVRKDGFVYLVSDVLSYRLQRNPLDYASRRLLPEKEITAITLPSGTRLMKSGVAWELHPEDAAITADALQALVSAWRNATAMKVTAANSVPRDGDVLITFEDGSELRFGVEARETELLLARADPTVTYVLPLAARDELLELSADTDE